MAGNEVRAGFCIWKVFLLCGVGMWREIRMERCYLMKTHSLQLLFSHLEERRMVESQQRGRLGRFWRLCDTIFPCFIIFIQFFMVFVVLKLQILDFCTKIKISDFFLSNQFFSLWDKIVGMSIQVVLTPKDRYKESKKWFRKTSWSLSYSQDSLTGLNDFSFWRLAIMSMPS